MPLTPADDPTTSPGSMSADLSAEEVWAGKSIESSDDPQSQKVCQIIDLNLFVSSSDAFRHAAGGYFHAVSSEGATPENPNTTMTFVPFEWDNPINSHLAQVTGYASAHISVESLEGLPGSTGYGTIIPNFIFVAAVHGDSNVIADDKHWKIVWTGGTIDSVNYRPIFMPGTYEDHYMIINRPYAKIDSHLLKNPETVTNWVDVSYKYKHHLANYQSYADNVTSELYLPNWYLLKHAGIHSSTGSGDFAAPGQYDYVSNDGKFPEAHAYFYNGAPAIVQYREDDPDTQQNENLDSGQSMAGEYLNTLLTSSLTTTTQEYAMKKFKNIMFNNNFYNDYQDYAEGITGSMAYYNTISFETTSNTTNENNIIFSAMAAEYGMDTLLLRLLKEAFLEQAPLKIAPHTLQYNKYLKYLSSSVDSDVDSEIKEYTNVEYRGVNFIDLMLYSYHQTQDAQEDFAIIDSNNLQTRATYDTAGAYRHYNTTAIAKMLNLATGISQLNMNVTNMSSLLNGKTQSSEYVAYETVYGGPPVPKYNEVIAYRIEKTGIANPGSPTPAAQNFWFFNSTGINSIDLFDTQIKYDKDYTYKIYSYNIVIGLKYRYSNLQLSRVIGQAYEDDVDATGEKIESGFCIEYYDPSTDDAIADLLTEDTYTGYLPDISDLATEAQRIAVDIASDTARPYRANFLVTIQPSMKIMEIPLYEKTQRVTDHLPSYLSITPSFTKDNTNRLSFLGSYQSFVPQVYPNTITAEDTNVKAHYLHANNIIDTTLIELPTVSRQSSIDIYRIEEKPTSYESFDGHFLRSVDLTVSGFESSYTDIYFYDIVKSNKTYYYLFRASNNLGMSGYFEEVLSAELVNDGGYKYAIFDTLFEEGFGEDSFVETSRPAKKIFQLSPSAAQRSVNAENVNYEESAAEQFDNVTIGEAEDLIWDKTFKIRLTSKKTNKKIDLNIKYLQTDDNY